MKLHPWLLPFLVALFSHVNPLSSQNLFVQKMVDSPGAPTVGARTALADIDNDGDLDLAGPDVNGLTLLIYQNQNGAIDTFPQRIPSSIPSNPNDFFLTDWNQDGLQDWVQVQGSGNYRQFYLYTNLGGLTFSAPVLLFSDFTNGYEASFGAKDLNNDSYPDIYNITDKPLVYLNNGGQASGTLVYGSFSGPVFSSGTGFNGVFLDYDGNGTIEFVGKELVSLPLSAHLIVFQHAGDFNFTMVEQLWDEPRFISAADLNNDGADEIIFVDWSNQFHAMSFQTGNQIWNDHLIGPSIFVPGGGGGFNGNDLPQLYPITDVDGNGFNDIAFSNLLLFNQGNFQFTTVSISATPNSTAPSLVIGDTDQDGKKEIWWSTEEIDQYPEPAGVFRYEYAGNQLFEARERMWTMYPMLVHFTGSGASNLLFDCNLDGQQDLVYFSNGGVVLSVNHNGVFSEKHIAPLFCARCLYGLRLMDVDGDGQQDILVQDENGTVWLKKTGTEDYQPMGYFSYNQGIFWEAFPKGIHDFDNDGLEDLILYSTQSGINSWAFAKNLADGTFAILAQGQTSSVGWPFVTIDDFNNDGYDDFVLYQGFAYAFLNQGGTSFTQTAFGGGHTTCGLADVTGDGKKDIIFHIEPEDFLQIQDTYALPSNGDGTFGLAIKLEEGVWRGDINNVLFDVNNDGLDDLVSDFNLLVALNQGTGFGPSVYQGDLLTSHENFGPVVDYDGDGDLDIFNVYPVSYWENVTIGSYQVHGQVFFDTNGNGQRDAGELPLPGLKAGIDSLQSYAVSDSTGRFVIPTGRQNGPFEVQIISNHLASFAFTTPHPALANVSENHPNDTLQIGLQVIGGADADVQQVVSSHRCSEAARLWLGFTPITAGPAEGELRLTFPQDVIFSGVDSLPGVQVNGQEIRWPLNQLPSLVDQNLWADFLMPNYQSAGDTLLFSAELLLHIGQDSAIVRDTMATILTCAYDPNDKQIANFEQFFAGDQYYSLTAPDRVEYVIRFQNTGNDTARQVVILDNLDPVFDYTSFQFQSSSHDCRINLDNSGLLRIEFPAINLPDSATNFLGSMGYVKFAVSLNPDPPLSRPILNSARILFDQNPPVYTNLTRFSIIDCSYFGRWNGFPDLACEGDSLLLSVPNYGLEQTYAWTHNGAPVSQSDTARVHVTGINNEIGLHVSNAFCSVDTAFYFHSNGGYPDLQLSIDSSITICEGYPIEIASNIFAQWYRNDTLAQGGTSYWASTPQTLTVASYIDGVPCVTKKTIEINVAPLPDQLILEADPSFPILRCPGDPVVLSTPLSGGFYWLSNNQITGVWDTFVTAEITFYPEVSNYVELHLDTLNCQQWDFRNVYTISQGDMEIGGETILCEGVDFSTYYTSINGQYIPFDSMLVFRDDVLVQAAYSGWDMFVQPSTEGEYVIVVYSACRQDTFIRTITHFDDHIVEITTGIDSLYLTEGQNVTWYHADSPSDVFNPLPPLGNGLSDPPMGYYFASYSLGICFGYTDTIYYQTTGLLETNKQLDIRLFPNPTAGAITLDLSRPSTPGTVFRIIALTGQVLLERRAEAGSLRHNLQVAGLPAGLYLLQVVVEGKVMGVGRFVKK